MKLYVYDSLCSSNSLTGAIIQVSGILGLYAHVQYHKCLAVEPSSKSCAVSARSAPAGGSSVHRILLQVTVLTDHDVVQRLLLTSMGHHRAAT